MNLFKSKKTKKTEFLVSFCSLLALAAINYTVIHSPYVFLMTFVLFIHELGHYFVAKKHKAFVKYPIFLPIPFIGIGITKVKNIPLDKKATVAMAGVLFSLSFILALIVHNIIFNLFSFYFLFTILFTETFFNYIGVDGSKYRSAKYETTQN